MACGVLTKEIFLQDLIVIALYETLSLFLFKLTDIYHKEKCIQSKKYRTKELFYVLILSFQHVKVIILNEGEEFEYG